MEHDREKLIEKLAENFAESANNYREFLHEIFAGVYTTTLAIELLEDLLLEFCDRYEKDLSLQSLYETACKQLEREVKRLEDDV